MIEGVKCMKRGKFLVIMALILAVSMLASCNRGSGGGTASAKRKFTVAICGINLDDGVNVTTQANAQGYNTLATTLIKQKFPDLEIEFVAVPWDGADARIRTLLQSNGADLFNQGGAFMAQYFKEGLSASLTPFMEKDQNWRFDDVFPANLKSHPHVLSYDGKDMVALPWAIGYRLIIYDSLLFDQWGVEYLSEYPTPEEILDKARRMTGINPVTGEQNYGVWLGANSLNMSFIIPASEHFGDIGVNGNFDDPRNLRWSLNSPGYVKAVQWAVDLARFSPPASATGQGAEKFGLENNDIAIGVDRGGGPIMGVYYRTGNDRLIARFVPTMHMGTNGGNWTPVDGLGINASLRGANADMAWELLKYIAGPEVTKWRFDNWGPSAMPYKNAATNLYNPKDIFLIMNARVAAVSTHPGYEVNPFYGSGIQPELASMLSRSIAGRAVNVQAELDALQAKAAAWSASR